MKIQRQSWLTVLLLNLLLLIPAISAGETGQEVSVEDLPDVYNQTYLLEAEGQYEKALSTLTAIEDKAGGQYFYQLRKGWLAYLSGDYSLSSTAYQRANSLKPASLESKLGLLLPLMAMRSYGEAIRTAEEILKADPLNYLANLRLATVYYQSGKYEKAAARYESLARIYPGDLTVANGMGWCRLKQGKKKEAERIFRSILSLAPSYQQAQEALQQLQ